MSKSQFKTENIAESASKRIKLTLEYDGTNYSGWQIQRGLKTVQGELTAALCKACRHNVSVMGSGRTDEGVHAVAQVAHFDSVCTIPPKRMREAVNYYLPDDIRITHSCEAASGFHAMQHAKKKTYQYNIYCSDVPSPLKRLYYEFIPYKLNVDAMKKAAGHICGTHDFTSFMASGSRVKSPVRTVYSLDVIQQGQDIFISVCGNGFLYNMVRIIAGTLVEVGRGKIMPEQIPQLISAKDRTLAGKTMGAQGLYLMSVEY